MDIILYDMQLVQELTLGELIFVQKDDPLDDNCEVNIEGAITYHKCTDHCIAIVADVYNCGCNRVFECDCSVSGI